MKNVLFIGPYRTVSGWGQAAREYIWALIKAGVNLTLRPIYMGGDGICECPVEFLEYEDNVLPHYDVVIQNVLPHILDYNSKFGKNIALIYTETTNWQNVWASRLNQMDEIWVPSGSDVYNLQGSGVHSPQIRTIEIPIDVKKFQQTYKSKELNDLKKIKDENGFVFYFIGELIQRKGIDKLLQAFHLEFDTNENVHLLLKVGQPRSTPDSLAKQINDYCNRIKAILRIYHSNEDYKKELFITNRLPENDLYALHNLCDCFVMPSMGESWSIPSMDALGFGKNPIVIEGTGPTHIVNSTNGYIVPSFLDHVLVLDPPLPDIYTGRELWHNYSIADLCAILRRSFENRNIDNITKKSTGIEDIYKLSYDNIAEKIKKVLE